jgi:hypothetical protein
MRKLVDGTKVKELKEPITLTVYTKCPEKWMLVDKETGEVYIGHVTKGKNSWKKIATWDGKDA